MAAVGGALALSSSSCSLVDVAHGLWFGDVACGDAMEDLQSERVIGNQTWKGSGGACAEPTSGPREGWPGSVAPFTFPPVGTNTAKPVGIPTVASCKGIGDLHRCMTDVSLSGPPKKDYPYADCYLMGHLGGVEKFWENIRNFGGPRGTCMNAQKYIDNNKSFLMWIMLIVYITCMRTCALAAAVEYTCLIMNMTS